MTVGGGVEETDADVEAALHREVFEELPGIVRDIRLVRLVTDSLDGSLGVRHVFEARFISMNPQARTGSEPGKPERGGYEVGDTAVLEYRRLLCVWGAVNLPQAPPRSVPLHVGPDRAGGLRDGCQD
ncbi:hypothetical protein GCM10010430_43530 [Kitasatospora cystarginea]|uniref:Nudix hydrolase domain-containing protein n=1 Tax=Kitasatospora cystarginea TaxID=58350 RepID=A0ABP5RA85_9ACTN